MNNPTLAGGIYGYYITAGRPVFWNHVSGQTTGIILIGDGGKHGLASVTSFEYKGDPLVENTNWKFHPGTLTAQIVPVNISSINTGTDVVTTSTSHGLSNGQLIRFGVAEGALSGQLDKSLKYMVSDVSGNTFKVKNEAGSAYINFTDAGSGTQKVWRANAGFDDPVQGLPTFCPEADSTFSHIAYVEFKLPTNRSEAGEQPDWQDFRIVGVGRKLMDFNASGTPVGVTSDEDLLANVALQVADNWLNNLRAPSAWMDWASWYQFRNDAHTLIWQRIRAEDVAPETAGAGFSGRYYQDHFFTEHKLTRTDATINMSGDKLTPPAPGVTANGFSYRATGKIKPRYSEVYTFSIQHDDAVKLWVNGQLLINNTNAGTTTATMAMVADELYEVQIDYVQYTYVGANDWILRFRWQSASQAFEVVPASRTVPTDIPVYRYAAHMAFPFAVEAGEVHERLMERAPGYHWTDRDGKLEFLPPSRESVFTFELDRVDDDSVATFVKGSFQKKRRSMADRLNFRLFRFRNVLETGFPWAFVEADREELRKYTNGEPSNQPADDLGVSTRSLAERMAEMEMVLKSDPDHGASISGSRPSSAIRKNEIVTVAYTDRNGNYVADGTYIVDFHSWGSAVDRNDFTLTPVTLPFYADEPYTDD